MEKLKRKYELSYYWKCDDGKQEILEHHIEALEETAENLIKEMQKEGNYCGELHDNIFMIDEDINDDGEQGISYSGWWNLSRVIVELKAMRELSFCFLQLATQHDHRCIKPEQGRFSSPMTKPEIMRVKWGWL